MTETNLTAAQERYSNLDGLRGIAALAVVLAHIELHKPDFGFQRLPIPFLLSLGSVAVTIFFVLSGFVITNLLLKETVKNNTINTRNFYIRRVLRIFPLYFLVLLLGFLIYAGSMSVKGILLSVFFLPNLAYLQFLLPAILHPIWSIGVEEQFYAVHPFIMRFINRKKLPMLFAVLILVEIFSRNLYLLPILKPYNFFYSLHNFLLFARYDTILLGCMGAIYFNRLTDKSNNQQLHLFTKKTQFALLLLFGVLLYFTVMYNVVLHELYAGITAILILNLCRPATSIISISSKPFIFLGKISYGIYLLHKFGLYAVLYLFSKIAPAGLFVQNIIIYIAVAAVSILLAWLSYTYYESYFLQKKARYS